VSAVPSSIIEPIGVQCCGLLPPRQVDHPLGCHRPRVPDRVVFDQLVQVLVFGCAYARIADATCSATTLRRRRDEWMAAGVMTTRQELGLAAYERMIGLALGDVAIDGCITKAPGGGEVAGRSPVDRGKQGLKRSTAVDAAGIPLGAMAAPANCHDSPLLEPTLDTLVAGELLPAPLTIHLDRGYDSRATRDRLTGRGLRGEIAGKGRPAPMTAGQRWVVERTNAWTNAHKRLVWWSERRARVVAFRLAFSAVIIIVARLIRQAWTRYRWDDRPRRRP
jgi:transposase